MQVVVKWSEFEARMNAKKCGVGPTVSNKRREHRRLFRLKTSNCVENFIVRCEKAQIPPAKSPVSLH